MPLTIERIEDNEHFEYTGDVTINAGIGKNASVIIKDGSLVVNENVGERSDVRLVNTRRSAIGVTGVSFYSSGNSVSFGGAGYTLQVIGHLGSQVKIKTESADINIEGNIGANTRLNTQSGDINAANVDINATLNTMSGDIHVANVAEGATLETMSGDIHAADVSKDVSLSTMSGDVKVTRAHPSVSMDTMSGHIYEGGVKRRKPTAQNNSACGVSFGNVSIGGLSFLGGRSSRIIVNGRDITDMVSNNTDSSSPSTNEPPVRFTKI